MIKAIEINNRQLQITTATTASDIDAFTAGARRVALIDETGRAAWYTDHADGAKILATFQAGGVYQAGSLKIAVLHRTRCYATIAGYGRRLIREWPTGGEVVLIPVGKKCDIFCFSWRKEGTKMIHNNRTKVNGEIAIRQLSAKAQQFYSDTETVTVYGDDGLYDCGNDTGLTIEQLDAVLTECQDQANRDAITDLFGSDAIDAVLRVYEAAGIEAPDIYAEDVTEHIARSGRKVFWYLDATKEAAVYADTGNVLTAAEMEREMY